MGRLWLVGLVALAAASLSASGPCRYHSAFAAAFQKHSLPFVTRRQHQQRTIATEIDRISGGLNSCDRRQTRLSRLFFSSTGGGDLPPPPRDGNNGDSGESNSDWDDFLNPKGEESESLRRARDFMSEQSLPLSFDVDIDDNEADSSSSSQSGGEESAAKGVESDDSQNSEYGSSSSALVGPGGFGSSTGPVLDAPSAEALANNPYMQVVSKLSPSELISKFTATANPRVQGAVRNTILGLIGSLPKMAFDTTTITTGQRLASLMFQLQMTGYMFKNADYRLSLSQSLGMGSGDAENSALFRLTGSESDDDDDDDAGDKYPVNGKVKGKLKLRYGGSADASDEEKNDQNATSLSAGMEMEVDAAAYMSELRSEVQQLRDELTRTKKSKEEEIRKDLLLYIRTMPEGELRSLTNTMSQDVLLCMKGLVNAVMAGIGDGQITANTVTEQSGEAMAQLCMWQLVVGYNLRELEVREEMKRSLLNGSSPTGEDDASSPGSFE